MKNGEHPLILNVDDREANRYIKSRDLQSAGYEVLETGSGADALRLAEERQPQVVLLDVKLPDISGFEVCRTIKSRWPQMMVLLTSATFTGSSYRTIGLEAGADSYLVQPADPLELAASVAALLRIRASEDRLRQLNDKLNELVAERTRDRDRIWNLATDLMCVVDAEGRFVSTNPAFEARLGWTAEELRRTSFANLLHPDDVSAWKRELESIVHGGRLERLDNRLRGKDGRYRWQQWSGVPERGFIYFLARDVTAEKEQREALLRAEEQLRQTQKMEAIGQLTGGIAHDFNNMLAVVISGLNLLQRRLARGETEVSDLVAGAIDGAIRASSLTKRLLAFSRQQDLTPEPVDVGRMITGMIDLLRRTLGERVTIVPEFDTELWKALVDPSQLENVVLNLAVNARDAMPDGGTLHIEATNVELAQQDLAGEGLAPGQYVCITVSDTGVGMPCEVMEKAFEPFFTTKELGKGTGLGLSQVFGFVRQSGGDVKIESEVGRGTRIRVYLPRLTAEYVEREATPSLAAGEARAGECVLIVEDEPQVREYASEALRDFGYVVLEAASASDAIRILDERQDVSLMITDMMMPEMTGEELASRVRQKRPEQRVLFISGYARTLGEVNGSRARNQQFLPKPFDLDQLARAVRASLDRKAPERSA